MSATPNGTQRDIGEILGELRGIRTSISELRDHIHRLEFLSTKVAVIEAKIDEIPRPNRLRNAGMVAGGGGIGALIVQVLQYLLN